MADRLLWVAATPLELACVPSRCGGARVVTGCGPAAAGAGLAWALARERPDLVVGIGIAGAYHGGLGLGDVVRVARDGFVDLGCEDGDNFLELWQLGLPNSGVEPVYELAAPNFLAGLPAVGGATCSVGTGTTRTGSERSARTGAGVESMEGAAWALACGLANVPFAQVRAISNFAGLRDRASWKIPQALLALTQTLESVCPV